MAEFEESEQDVRDYIKRQVSFYRTIEYKHHSSVEQWVGFKLGSTSAAAVAAIRWAEAT
jgi:hypothetical protein